jgi:hypothetical protein
MVEWTSDLVNGKGISGPSCGTKLLTPDHHLLLKVNKEWCCSSTSVHVIPVLVLKYLILCN